MTSWFNLLNFGLTLLFGGITLWCVPGDRLPTRAQPYVWTIGLSSAGLGAILIVCYVVRHIRVALTRSRAYVTDRISALLVEEFDDLPATPAHVRQLCELGTRFAGDRHPPEPLLLRRLTHNPRTIRAVAKSTKPSTVAAYYVIYALNRKGCDDINHGLITSGLQLDLQHLCKSFRKATGIYVSMLVGTDLKAKAWILHLLKYDLGQLRLSATKLKYFFARPGKEDGRRLVSKYHFHVVNATSGMWRLDL
jgi:hypothetical protein